MIECEYPPIQTKWGTARVDKRYYRISTGKEGFNRKFLHRLIFEDEHKCSILSWALVHHIDGDKLNNNISNLELMMKGEHGKHHSLGRLSPTRSTNYFRVYKKKCPTCKQGFSYVYEYSENGKHIIGGRSVSLKKLEEKVKSKGLEWREIA